jgi:hypothetical protein
MILKKLSASRQKLRRRSGRHSPMLQRTPIGRRRVRRFRTSRNLLPKLFPDSSGEDSCGCSMGLKFLASGLILAIIWYGWRGRGFGVSIDHKWITNGPRLVPI